MIHCQRFFVLILLSMLPFLFTLTPVSGVDDAEEDDGENDNNDD